MESSTAARSGRSAKAAESGAARAERQASSPARLRGMVLARRLMVGDTLAAGLGAALALLALDDPTAAWIAFVAFSAALWPVTAFSIGLYRSDQLAAWASAVSEIPRGFVALLLVTWPLFGVASLLGIGAAIAVTFATIGATVALSGLSRSLIRANLHRKPGLQQRTLILGSGVVAGEVVKKLRDNRQFGIVPVGLVDDDVHHIGTPDLPLLGSISHLREVLASQQIDRVIIAFSRASHEDLLEAIRACRDTGVAVDVVPRLFEFLDGVRALDQVGGLPLLSLGPPGLSKASLAAKRVLDVGGSLFLIAVFSPLMLAIAIAIKLESRGPVFFRQPRAGRHNTSFRLIKFRSMYSDAEQRKEELGQLNEAEDGVMFKIRKDPRVTRVGRFIRRFSLDELPQLFNVVAGQMSLVGPRPLIFPETAALEEHWELRRLELRPGLTGPWQVYGRSQSPFQEMVRFDYQYVAGWSLARDVELLFATVPAVLSGRGAY